MKKRFVKKDRFPRIYRIYTDKVFWVSMASSVLLILISYVVFMTYSKFNKLQELTKERGKIIFEISHWEKIATNYKDYRDAYFKLAVLEYQLGESEKSKNYLDKALELDPNFEKGRELEGLL